MSDEDILMRGGTEEDIAMYAHDVGNACMYPDYPCEICEARERFRAKERNDKIRKRYERILTYNELIEIEQSLKRDNIGKIEQIGIKQEPVIQNGSLYYKSNLIFSNANFEQTYTMVSKNPIDENTVLQQLKSCVKDLNLWLEKNQSPVAVAGQQSNLD